MPSISSENIESQVVSSLVYDVALAIISGGLLSVAFINHDLYFIAWIAFVPLLLATHRASIRRTYFLSLSAGVVAFATGSYWIVTFIMNSKGYGVYTSLFVAIFYWLYCAHLFALIAIMFDVLKRFTSQHDFLIFPLVVVAATSVFPMIFSFQLGDSQVKFITALQAIELTGVYGLDALIALVNVMVFRVFLCLVANKKSLSITFNIPWIAAVAVVSAWMLYGLVAKPIWDENIVAWNTVKVGLVQPNETPSLHHNRIYPGYSRAFPPEMDMSERLAAAGAELIIWPETNYKAYLDQVNTKEAYQRAIKALGVSLIFQDLQTIRHPQTALHAERYNSAVMLNTLGDPSEPYNKIKRIPFGEYVPMVSDIPALKDWGEGLVGEFLNEISSGTHHVFFEHEKVSIIPLICYETTFSTFVAKAVNSRLKKVASAKGNLLVGLSNNGWFGSIHQPLQHVVASVLRSVENRVPLVHVANNGPSIVVAPSGVVLFKSDFQRAGGYRVDVPYASDAQPTLYNRFPNLFIYAVYIVLAGFVVLTLVKRFRSLA